MYKVTEVQIKRWMMPSSNQSENSFLELAAGYLGQQSLSAEKLFWGVSSYYITAVRPRQDGSEERSVTREAREE